MSNRFTECPHCRSIHFTGKPGCILVSEWGSWKAVADNGECLPVCNDDKVVEQINERTLDANWPDSPYEVITASLVGDLRGEVYYVKSDKIIKLFWSEREITQNTWLSHTHLLYFRLKRCRALKHIN